MFLQLSILKEDGTLLTKTDQELYLGRRYKISMFLKAR